jgi:hypothetical protein
MLKRDENVPAYQLQFSEAFCYFQLGLGIAFLEGITYAAMAIVRNLGMPDDIPGYGLLLLGVSIYGVLAFVSLLIIFGRPRILFDRAMSSGCYWAEYPFPFRKTSMNMHGFVECFVCGIRSDDESQVYYSIRMSFKNSADFEIDKFVDQYEGRAIADEINQFWGVLNPQRETRVIDQQEELRKWAEKQP